MKCLSCSEETKGADAKVVLTLYLCRGCSAMAEKAEIELERESARALMLAKQTLAQHIMKGGLLRSKVST